LLIVNSKELNHKDQQKKKKTPCYHHLLHITTTIEEGDDIATVTFFAAKPPKKGVGRQFLTTKPLKKVTEAIFVFFSLQRNHNQTKLEGDSVLQ